MSNQKKSNELLGYFGVSSYKELLAYCENNPNEKKVIELKELFELVDVTLPGGEDNE